MGFKQGENAFDSLPSVLVVRGRIRLFLLNWVHRVVFFLVDLVGSSSETVVVQDFLVPA